MSQPTARPVSERLTGTTATRPDNEGWPPGNGRASKKSASHKAGRTTAHLATNDRPFCFAGCRFVIFEDGAYSKRTKYYRSIPRRDDLLDVIQMDVVPHHDDGRRNEVSRLQGGELARVWHVVGHRRRGPEAVDGVVLDARLLAIESDRQHLTFQEIFVP